MTNADPSSPRQIILTMRIIWAALILGPMTFAIVTAINMAQPRQRVGAPEPILTVISFCMLGGILLGFAVRWLIFSRGRTAEGVLKPTSYSTGNIVLWALCESAEFVSLIAAMVNHSFWPTIAVVGIGMACQVVTLPRVSAISRASY